MSESYNYRVIDILKMSTDYLEKKGIENPRLNVELLLGHVLKLSRVQLYLNFEKPLAPLELDQFREILKRHAGHEPIQYILGEAEFYSLKLKVNRSTLIPRPETEILVDTVIEQYKKNFDQQKTVEILDIGTGSGNIAIALAKNIGRAHITAIDILEEALDIAKQNADFHQVYQKINFIKQDIFTENIDLVCKYHIIVSNPPYISSAEFERLPLEVKNYEPYVALDGGEEGLTFHCRLVELSKKLLLSDGFIAIEIGAFQSDSVYQVFLNSDSFQEIKIINDLNGLPRVWLAKK
jgi:release factor glutamine methyltransferase